jgi:hypothetical protein
MGNLDGLYNASQFNLFMTPIELANLTWRKYQRHKGLCCGRSGLLGFPLFDETLNAIVCTAIPLGLQSFKQTLRGAALRSGQMALNFQPTFKHLAKLTQLGQWLLLTFVDRFRFGFKMFANGGARELQVAGNRADALIVHKVAAPDFGNKVHKYHSRFSGQNTGWLHTRSGNYWTLFTPLIWKVLHADLHATLLQNTENSGEVTVKRDSGMMGSGCLSRVYIDAKAVADLDTSEKVVLHLKEGDHIISATQAGVCGGVGMVETKVSVHVGGIYNYRIAYGSNFEFGIYPTAF